ncbi:uncharacterized protein LOC132609032 [Lycium barbarum]|uniref:uncharacterized protein LOC132609032 n=1 Tax=Lycium barbarum TaxID=112863 RepID=UPI00293ECA0A|nr:uncharacterized protein LOC132609032 [Lycium barbarum]
MEINQNLPNIQMIVSPPHDLQTWWRNIRVAHGEEVKQHLGSLMSLIGIQANKTLTKLLIEFWDPASVTFNFLDFEMTPTLEEICGFTDLPFEGRMPVLPSFISGEKFLHILGFNVYPVLRNVENDRVKFDFLFQRFGRRESFERHQGEFACDRGRWEKMRPRVFAIALLGILVFPKRAYRININLLPPVMNIFSGPDELTLVPMILAEMLRALSACSRGHNFFEGCNLLLQLWAVEHFYTRPPIMDYCIDARSRIQSHTERMRYWHEPTGAEEWHTFLVQLTGDFSSIFQELQGIYSTLYTKILFYMYVYYSYFKYL